MWEELPEGYWDFVDKELEEAKKLVSRYFPVASAYRMNRHMVLELEPYVHLRYEDPKIIDEKFNTIYKEAMRIFGSRYIPVMTEDRGQGKILLLYNPKLQRKRRGISINIALLIATIITTTLAGAMNWISYYYSTIGREITTLAEFYIEALRPENIINGLIYFALPLLAIIGIHEMGHYLASKRLGLDVTLPYFIPIPPLGGLSLGTLGAFINVREPLKTKKELVIVGAAGPICGFVVAIVVSVIGLYLMKIHPVYISPKEESVVYLVPSLVMQILIRSINIPDNVVIHPLAFAGWVGILVTGLNLLPIGQLDGGHVLRALLGKYQRYAAYATLMIMVFFSIYYPTWLIFIMLIVLLGGVTHPPPLNDIVPLDIKSKIIGIIAVILLILCFVPVPIMVSPS